MFWYNGFVWEHLFGGGVMNIETTVKKAKSKDKEALNELIRQFTPFILKMVANIYIKGYEREDLIQMGYLTIIKAVESYKFSSSSSFIPYVTNAIRNNYFYQIRKVSKGNYDSSFEKLVEEGEHFSNINKEDTIEEILLKKEQREKLKEIIKSLSPEEKELLTFSYGGGHGALKEYSKIKGIKYVTIQKRRKRLLERLREDFNKE